MDLNIIKFIIPLKHQFTVYSKSGCSYCADVKDLLQKNNITFTVIDCDEYLINHKPEFLYFINGLTNKDWRTFPMVFDNTHFIGGFSDTKQYLEKISNTSLDFNEDF